jgi:hypothetical protein
MVASDLGDQVSLEVFVEPSDISGTSVLLTANNQVFLKALEDCYNSIFSGAKVLVKDKILTGDEIRVAIVKN